jgi:CRP-like cAMP-binding protein
VNHDGRKSAANNKGAANNSHSTPITDPPGQNLILRALSADDLNALKPHLEAIATPVQFVLFEQSAPIEFAYFLDSGIASVVSQFIDGGSVETGITGIEGFWGSSLLAGVDHPPGRSFIQSAGNAFRIRKEVLMEQVRGSRAFEDLLLRASYLEHVQSQQLAACNARHEVVERLARWLLMCDDRVRNDTLTLTHEFLALMLGTRRSSVTIAAGTLQQAGLISYTRRTIRIVDRAELEDASCSCYRIIADEYERIIGLRPNRTPKA